MEKVGFSMSVVVIAVLAAIGLTSAGCGSNSTAMATFPRTPTPAALQQIATPVPTATAVPAE
jgi:hypothetical protein